MTSRIYPNSIDTTYPVAGQDNDTQGFRTNYLNIKNNFIIAAGEITALQSNVATIYSNISTINNQLQATVQSNATPVSSSSVGSAGQIAYDSTHIYVCVATNTWLRANLSTF
jgi:hypothetical protein